MVSAKIVEDQLKRIGFKTHGWGRTEVQELPNIILPDEEIYECVNGFYEGGFALLLATDIRVLLVDKKPLNYLTVEDMRYELISEIDYNHRLVGAYTTLSSGTKNLKFTSLNQPRLRKLIGHVQHCMAETTKKETTNHTNQNLHLQQINQRLRLYLLAQYRQQERLQSQLESIRTNPEALTMLPEEAKPIRPDPDLVDYLFAQGLLDQHQTEAAAAPQPAGAPVEAAAPRTLDPVPARDELAELYAEGRQEIFGEQNQLTGETAPVTAGATSMLHLPKGSPLRIAYSKLPLALRSRKFGRPLLTAPGQEGVSVSASEA